MVPTPRAELAGALDARFFGREATTRAERAERVRRFARAIGCSDQLARAILGGRRGLTDEHLSALTQRRGRGSALLTDEQRDAIREAEKQRKAAAPGRPQGRPPSPKKAADALRTVEGLARTAGDVETALRVRALGPRVAPVVAT